MVEVKAYINDFHNDPKKNDHTRETTRDQVEEALHVAGIDAEVSMCHIDNEDQLVIASGLVITSSDATAQSIREIVEGCDGIGGFVKTGE